MQKDGFTVTLVGNLVKDAERRFTQNGKSVVNFTMGTKNGYGEYERNWFPQVSIWGKDAENDWLLKNLYKGREVTIEASLGDIKPWENDTTKYNIEARCILWRLHGKGEQVNSNATDDNELPEQKEHDEIPF